MEPKEQEYIDHTLLAPEYLREASNFIIDLINFPKGLSSHGGIVNNALSPELPFTNGLFNENSEHSNDSTSNSTSTSISDNRKLPPVVHMPTNNAVFVTSPITSKYSSPTCATSIQTKHKVPQQFLMTETNVNLNEISTDKQCHVIHSNSRKLLPHKKRIPRKLKIVNGDKSRHLDVPLEMHERKLSYVDLFVMSSRMRFRCELCDHSSKTQLEFYVHLKQHYEPSSADTISATMKTTLDALGPERTDCIDGLHSTYRKEISEANGLAQVFHDVNFPFENFPQSLQSEQAPPHPIKISQSNANNQQRLSVSPIPLSPSSSGTSQSLPAKEFSDADDILEDIRDKVLVEDTCNTMDLITSNSNDLKPNWLNNSYFNGMELKAKAFSDALFNGTFQSLQPNSDTPSTIAPTNNDDKITNSNTDATSKPSDSSTGSTPIENHNDDKNVNAQLAVKNDILHEIDTATLTVENKTETPLVVPSILPHTQNASSRSKQKSRERKRKNVHQRSKRKSNLMEKNLDQSEDIKDKKHLIKWSTKNDVGIIVEGGLKKYVCKKCLRTFNSTNALKYHNRTHSGIRPHKCEVCEKKFFSQSALSAHMRIHTGAKPYKCEHCDRQFRQWGDLKYHTASIHSTVKAYTCEFCGKSFSRKYSLVVHVRIHTSERTYKCEWCDKAFRASSYLQSHRKVHTGEKPYQCDICPKKFRVSGDLNRHKRMHERQKLKFLNNIQ